MSSRPEHRRLIAMRSGEIAASVSADTLTRSGGRRPALSLPKGPASMGSNGVRHHLTLVSKPQSSPLQQPTPHSTPPATLPHNPQTQNPDSPYTPAARTPPTTTATPAKPHAALPPAASHPPQYPSRSGPAHCYHPKTVATSPRPTQIVMKNLVARQPVHLAKRPRLQQIVDGCRSPSRPHTRRHHLAQTPTSAHTTHPRAGVAPAPGNSSPLRGHRPTSLVWNRR